jgi:hypothetical protein
MLPLRTRVSANHNRPKSPFRSRFTGSRLDNTRMAHRQTRFWGLSPMGSNLGALSAQSGRPQTLVLYRTRPIWSGRVDFWRRAGRVRYSCSKEAADKEAAMQIQWRCRDEKDLGESVMERTGAQAGLVGL